MDQISRRKQKQMGDTLIVKSDYSGPLEYLARTKVLEIAIKETYILGNKLNNGSDLVESSGFVHEE
jgi:hypothetical protein